MPLTNFDPNSPSSTDSGIFGLPCCLDNSELVILPIPWDATTSYIRGTANSSIQVLEASKQVDLWDEEFPKEPWRKGIYMLKADAEISQENQAIHNFVEKYRTKPCANDLQKINSASEKLNNYVFQQVQELFRQNRKVILLGGEHSVSFGYYQALAERYPKFGILHIDAHLDLRKSYEDFNYSHASIMYNSITQIPQIEKIISLGIRDYCVEEANFVKENRGKITVFSERELQYKLLQGISWHSLAEKIIDQLPPKVVISWDIDGLDPVLCPHTGTPVMGGRSIYECYYLLHLLNQRNIEIIGVDLVEIGYGSEWDANVAARILYKLSQYLLDN